MDANRRVSAARPRRWLSRSRVRRWRPYSWQSSSWSVARDQPGTDSAAPATDSPATDPTIVGVITEVVPFAPITEDCIDSDSDADPDAHVSSDDVPVCSDPDTSPLGTVLVEQDAASETGENKISFTIGRNTTLLMEIPDNSTVEPLSFADLADRDVGSPPGPTVRSQSLIQRRPWHRRSWFDPPSVSGYSANSESDRRRSSAAHTVDSSASSIVTGHVSGCAAATIRSANEVGHTSAEVARIPALSHHR